MLREHKFGEDWSGFSLIGLSPTMIAETPLLLVCGDAPLDLQVSWGLKAAVVQVTAGP